MYKSFTSNKLRDNAESSDTFINKAVLTVASYTIPIFYHLPFAFMGTNKNGFISTFCFHMFH